MIYQIRVRGHLSGQWSQWFQGMSLMAADENDTVLTGQLTDQAELFGLLRKVRDLGMPLISVNRIRCDAADDPVDDGTGTTAVKKQEKGAKE
ncbi:MAG: hypothetical protein AB9880_12120 [Christensenellales bacterium]